jgi:hypothetical protein
MPGIERSVIKPDDVELESRGQERAGIMTPRAMVYASRTA